MTSKSTFRAGLFAATALAGMSPIGASARADDSISGIEQQIKRLEGQLARVKTDLAARHNETVRAQQEAEQARREARQADERANALAVGAAGGQSFQGAGANGLGGYAGAYPGTFSAENLPRNGLGPHGAAGVGEQQASGLGQYGKFRLGGVTITLGGFLAAESVTRTRNIVADIGSSFNAIPYAQSPQYHEPEFRGSARQSRLSLLVEGAPSTVARVAGYFETDFLSAGVSSNSNESNSYSLRVRQAYATFDRSDWGFHFLAGQAWSMLTLNRVGITPRQENIPLTIDAQYVVGFNWARQWQVRFVKDFNKRVWAGLSFEEPQSVYSVVTQTVGTANNVGGVIGGADNYANPGGSLLNSTANYSDDIAPDVVGKLAFDPGWGHYELDGLAKFLNARETLSAPFVNSGNNRTVLAGGGGAGMLLPIVGKTLVFQASGLVGEGIGRYGSGQLADATINQNGTPIPIPEVEALVGLVYHPTKAFDLYAYAGTEQQAKRSFNEKSAARLTPSATATACSTTSVATPRARRPPPARRPRAAWSTARSAAGGASCTVIGARSKSAPSTNTSARPPSRAPITSPSERKTVAPPFTPKTDDNMVLFSFRYLPFL